MFNFDELMEDYVSYREALEHTEDGDYKNYRWDNPEWAKHELGEELYEQVISSWKAKWKKCIKIYSKKVDLERDFK